MTNKKQEFIEYLKNNYSGNSTPSSYARAMEIIEAVLFTKPFQESTNIWDFINIYNVDYLYDYIRDQQTKEDNIFKDYKPDSSWKKGFCSAALKQYGKFLHESSSADYRQESPPANNSNWQNKKLDITTFSSSLSKAHLSFPKTIPYRFVSSLITKPFVILTGLSGSGKTKLAEAFAMWIAESNEQICMVSVGADWTNREPLLGFPNALEQGKYVRPDCGALDLILKANADLDRPYFLILDEMNMSHVERYFADFLSAMESTDNSIALHAEREQWQDDIPSSIVLPKNLFIIGTVNIDETTYMFSPKVLDRANVIEFRVTSDEMSSFLENPVMLDMEILRGKGKAMGIDFIHHLATDQKNNEMALKNDLMPFFKELHQAGAEFGYRTAVEMARFISICENLAASNMEHEAVIDAAIMQKLLPKVHGSRSKIEKILRKLGQLCLIEPSQEPFNKNITSVDIKYKLSYEKIERMLSRVITDGFTSYAEA